MKKIKSSLTVIIICSFSFLGIAGTIYYTKSLVDFDAYQNLSKKVKEHRKDRLVSVDEFLKMSEEVNTIILDTRSQKMYDGKHIKGAVHLDFSDFTASSLQQLIPNNKTRILIYCNNNFESEPVYFVTKSIYIPTIKKSSNTPFDTIVSPNQLTLALNIPTFINLYGYGYKNVYELNELVNTSFDKRIEFEGDAVVKVK
jgi:hypothetical protein